jgi:hypothetical protein
MSSPMKKKHVFSGALVRAPVSRRQPMFLETHGIPDY